VVKDADIAGNTGQTIFLVQGGIPIILSASPNIGQQGQQNLSVSITGEFTHFAQGASAVSFGSDITVNGVTVASATALTANITIAASASVGAHSVTITTATELAQLTNGFSVEPGTPAILSVDPNSGSPGQQTLGTVGSIFLTGHDPDFHAFAGPNTAGAADINKAAINFITNPGFNTFAARGIHKFLYATSSISPPGGHVDGTNGLVASGYVLGTDFDRADASTLVGALGQLGTQYDALVVASDFGGILTQAELDVLNAHSADLINFLNQGGGVYAMAEPTPALGGLASSGFFGFLPFAVSSTPLAASESGNSLTSFGVTLGLTNTDINGNFLHNIFASTGGLSIVDADPGGEILSLAGRGKVTPVGTGSVIITGQFTHFLQGITQASFGPGITIGTVTVVDASHLIVQITIDPNAIPGGRTVTVTTGNEVAALSDGFTVLGAPQLLTISPNAGQQGQTNLAVTLIGQNTHFAQGVTTVDLGPGISVGPVTVTDATHLTAQVTIDPAAAVGARTVTVTTGAEIASLPNSFLVTGLVSNPTITSVIPNSGQQGQQNLSVTIAGLNTHFVQGTTTASFGTGITVASLTVNSATSATAVLNIGPAAVVGARSVTLTTSTEVVTLANAFTVQVIPNQPPVVSAGPAQTITLPNAAKLNGAVTDDGLPVGGILTIAWSSVSGPGTVSFSNPNAPVTTASFSIPGIYVLRLTANDSQLTTSADVTITINMADLLVGDLSDNSIKRYDGITGAFLGDFVAPAAGGLSGPTYYTFGPDGNLYVGSINTGSIKRYNGITGVYIDDFVPTGSGGGIEPYAAVFGPDRNLYVSSGYIPSSGVGGDVKKFNGVTGAFMEEFVPYLSGDLEYAQGILFGPDGNLYVCNQSSVTNTAAIKRYNGATGAFMGDFVPLSVTTDPVDLKFGPDGDLYVSLFYGHTIERYNGTTGADLGAFVPSGTGGLTWVPDLAFGPNGDLYTVERYAHAVKEFNGATGQYVGDIVSSASTQNGGLGESFALLWMIRPPNTVLTQASPNNGQQGQQNLSVALTGLNTHFGQGVTTATFGSGITVVSVTVNSATSTTVLLNIDPSAVIGARDVTLATGAEVVTLSSGFAVTAGTGTGTPILAQVNPNSGRQGQQNLSVAITGQNTHFSQGTTTASFGSAITVASLTVNSATSATAILNIDPGAAVGPRTVTVTTGTEVAALSGGFLIVTGNQPPVVSASAGCSQTIAILPDLITVSEYPATTTPAGLQGIAVGTDCNLWFTEAGGNKIGRITTSGVVTEFPIPTGGSQPEPITAGPDGNLWFGEGLGNKIGRISTAGAITEFSIPTGGSQFRFGSSEPRGITAGPDGNLWFTEFAGNKIGRITTAGLIAEFAISTGGSLTNGIVGSAPYGITPGPDGNLWFVEAAGNNVGRITPGGVITEFPIPTAGSVPMGITADPDGNLWFAESAGNKVGRITTAGVITEFPIPTSNATPIRITAGPDGNLWFTEVTGNKVGRITSAGVITEYSTPTSLSVPEAITAGPDGNMWFTENATNVGKINPFTGIAFATLTGSVADDGLPVGATLTATWSAIGAPGTVLFGNPTVTFPNAAGKANPVATSATFSVPGTYTLSLTGSDSQLNSSSSVTITVNPSQTATTILSVNPNTGSQGQANLSVTITGQNTHFGQGTTTVDLGPGITVGSVTVTDATHLTAQVTIDVAAAVGARTVTATTGAEVASLANGFLVTGLVSGPTITTVSPNSGQQGQGGPVTIVGQNTHFVQGTTQVDFGAGIAVSGITVACPTCLSVQLQVVPTATPGPRTIIVTTGTEVAILTNGFTVLPGTPILTSLVPAGGQQGQSLSVTITGQYTHFTQGITQVNLGAGITVSNINATSPALLTAQLTIDPAALVGTTTLTVTTGAEVVSVPNVFTVQQATPVLLTLNPGGGQQGQSNLSVAITGLNTHFVQGTSQITFGTGVIVTSFSVSSSTSASAVVNIDPATTIGTRTVTVTTGTEVVTFNNGFTVAAGTPAILSVNPSTGQQGQQNLSVALTGQLTHFVQGTTTASLGAGVTVASLTIGSATAANVVISVDPAAALGSRDVTLTTGTEVAVLHGGFAVTGGTPALVAVVPNNGQQGQQNLSVGLTGQFTHFVQGTTTANFGIGITVVSVSVTSPTIATAVLSIDPAAVTGGHTVTVTTGADVVTLTNAFTVAAGTPALFSVNPNSGQQGQQNLTVIISGTFTHFVQATTTANFGAGIIVASLTVGSPTSATAVLNIDPAAASGIRNVTLTTGPEIVTLGNGFTVTQVNSGPTIISLSPNSALTGQSIQVTITAQNTHFVQGTTQVNFGPQISVGAGPSGGYGPVQVTSPTTAIAQVSVPNNAVLGLRTVVARTGTELAEIVNGFATTSVPYISSLSPYHGQPGQTISVTITGVFTNFQQGVTQATFGPGISVGGAASGGPGPVTVTSSSTATAQITIDSAATPGLRTPVTVATGTEQASYLNSGFLVLGPVTGPGPVVNVMSPTEGSEVTAPTTVTGTVTSPNLSNWVLEYQASGSTVFTQFASGTTSTVSGTLDPTLLLNGIAKIRLTGVDQSGQTTSAIVNVVITRNTKVGNFTLSFNDLTIPVAGIPIQIIRTYDSRNKSSGDFGFGWSLDINTTKVDVNGTLGGNWAGTTTGGAFPTYCVQATKNYVVSVRAPGGTVYQFAPRLNGACQQLAPPSTVDMVFTPTGATQPNAALTAANATGLLVNSSFPGQAMLIDQSTASPFDPDQFTLTLPTGQRLQVSVTFGIQNITDTNGNTLTITSTGIASSAGKAVTFARDAQNRITTIADPSSEVLTYSYDANGDLATFTDQLNNISTFTYDATHNLLSFKDPSGIQPIRNVYDDSGRLIQQVDAFGNIINFTHDLGARTETVTDFLGNPTTYVYDSDGNIISTTDALGNVTTATFDTHDNKLSETNALGKTSTYTYDANNNRLAETDPLAHTTTNTYNSRNQVLTITDALSRATTNTYDASGNLLSTNDPAGNSTSYTYNAQGLRLSTTDALGGISSYLYDASGNLTQQTDPLGNIITYTYDSNGNRLTQTKTRTTASGRETLVTSYQYDGLNRVTATTYPDGPTTQIQYNAIGKQSVTVDQLGRQTSYQYDAMGRLTQTTYPDATTEMSAYDALGNRISSNDRGGRTTTFVFDPLKRLTNTRYPDGASAAMTYDGIGEVTAVTDPRGNQTKYQYDAAGHRTSVTDPLNHVTSFAYDAAGNQVSMTDANVITTQYQYDALNRRTKTIYPDTTSDSFAYDALGRTISKTDQAGQATQFQYDKLGRLTQVTDALSQATKYAYDEVGNRISQTDANSHTTTFAYDKLGRRTTRTLPLGMVEGMSYDAAGNLVSKTDFNGKTTTYAYDQLNRLTTKTPDGSFAAPTVSFTYTSTGPRQTMTDASGATSYSYDLRDRLTQKASPEGTLSYTYDLAGNLASIQSSNAGGTSVAYIYDLLNRLTTVQDNRSASGTTTYSYDNVGNLQGHAYPNGVQTAYSYNALNRLTNVAISKGAPLASYAYLLGPSGNRMLVNELGGRQVSYSYDSL